MLKPKWQKLLLLEALLMVLLGGLAAQPLTTAHAQAAETTERPLLMAHYMPWYQTPDVSGYWGWHWTMEHFVPAIQDDNGRPEIASHYMPLTGPYDSQDETVLEYQVLLMKLSGIDGLIVDWYGTEDFRDYAVLNASTLKLFEYTQRAGLRFALCYEDQTVLHMVNEDYLSSENALQRAQEDMQFAQEHWFSHESYLTYEGQPLLFVFGPQFFRQPTDWETIFAELEPTPALVTLDGHMDFAALSSYPWPPMELAGGIEMAPAVLESYLERFYRNARRRDLIVAGAFPAFHDIYAEAGVRSSYGYINPQDGQTLRLTLDLALAQNPGIVQLITWNDYGEGTIIEPTEEFGYRYLEIIQQTRQTLSPDFAATSDDLRLPFELFQLRRAHAGDAAINAQLDQAFAAIIAGDTTAAQSIIQGLQRS